MAHQNKNIQVRELPSAVDRSLLAIDSKFGLLFKELDPQILENLTRIGQDINDPLIIIKGHLNSSLSCEILGLHEEVRRRFILHTEGGEIEVHSDDVQICNYWLGSDPYTRLITPEEASRLPYAGKTALDWAASYQQIGNIAAVVKASNGFYYPASKNDKIITAV